MKPDLPPGLWENATAVHEKSRSATLKVVHLPAIEANMSSSVTGRSTSSAKGDVKAIERYVNATAATRQQMRITDTPEPKFIVNPAI